VKPTLCIVVRLSWQMLKQTFGTYLFDNQQGPNVRHGKKKALQVEN